MEAGNEPELDERLELTFGGFILGYLSIVLTTVAAAMAAEHFLHIDGTQAIVLACGALFLLAAWGKPRRLYLIIRNAGWFSSIKSPTVMRAILAVAGALFFLGGLLTLTGTVR